VFQEYRCYKQEVKTVVVSLRTLLLRGTAPPCYQAVCWAPTLEWLCGALALEHLHTNPFTAEMHKARVNVWSLTGKYCNSSSSEHDLQDL